MGDQLMGLYTRDTFYMWAVHGQCPQFSRSLLWPDLRVFAGPTPRRAFKVRARNSATAEFGYVMWHSR